MSIGPSTPRRDGAEEPSEPPRAKRGARRGRAGARANRCLRVAACAAGLLAAGWAQQALSQAEQALQQGRLADAVALLEPYAAAHPDDFGAELDLGFAYAGLHRDADAIRAYNKGLAAHPGDAGAQINLAILLEKAGQNAEALPHLRQATTLEPDSEQAWELQARALAATGDAANAVSAWDKAAALAPAALEPRLEAGRLLAGLKQYPEAERRLQAALALQPGSDAVQAALIDVYTADHNPAAAALLPAYVGRHPESVDAHLAWAALLRQTGQAAAAEREYTAALALDANRDAARLQLAQLQLARKDYADAIENYRVLMQAQPNSGEAHYALGAALMEASQLPQAGAELRQAVRLEPAAAPPWGDLAFVEYKLKDYPAALDALRQRSRLIGGDDVGILYLRAIMEDDMGQWKPALADYQRFLDADAQRPAAQQSPDEEFKARHRIIALKHLLHMDNGPG